MTQRVYLLTYRHRYGEDTTTWAARDDADLARAVIIMDNLADEVTDADVRRAISDAYDNDDYDTCHSLYTTEVENESLEIEESELKGAETKRPFIVVDSNTDLAHRVLTWPFGENTGTLFCGTEFLWQCPQTQAIARFMYLPREPPVLSRLQCIAKETK